MTEHTEKNLYMILPQIIHLYFSHAYTLMDEIDIHPGQVPLLFTLRKHDGCSQRELAELLHVKPPSMTVMLTRMARNGMVERKADAEDQRISRIYITETGRRAAVQVEEILDQIERDTFRGLTPEEILLMQRLLRQIKSNLYEVCGKDPVPHCHEHLHGHPPGRMRHPFRNEDEKEWK